MVKSQIDAVSRNGERDRHFPRRSGERRHKMTVDHKPWSHQHRCWKIALNKQKSASHSSWVRCTKVLFIALELRMTFMFLVVL